MPCRALPTYYLLHTSYLTFWVGMPPIVFVFIAGLRAGAGNLVTTSSRRSDMERWDARYRPSLSCMYFESWIVVGTRQARQVIRVGREGSLYSIHISYILPT